MLLPNFDLGIKNNRSFPDNIGIRLLDIRHKQASYYQLIVRHDNKSIYI
ncbi:hypothetical protein SAMN03080601_00848 [Alkalitalea saponilacus]|uniref:Uncharacterized protein n=1 Tax=Alkalitalea saponilacus TaxID=889453 RepID=A0A1T5CK69_9BACT|nr:hypothetical protein SAMN03080601_00848 [Alkalitalea saponilacus]